MRCAARWSPDPRVNCRALVITQGLVNHQDGVALHPDLFLWAEELFARRKRWFHCKARHPLDWYADLIRSDPTTLLLSRARQLGCDLPDDARQHWIASPYHAQLLRETVQVMPEGQFEWSADDARALAELLNPLLEEEGMKLSAIGAAMLLSCRTPFAADPLPFAAVAGHLLPNRHHDGSDGGRLNRLLAEIQMLLFQHSLASRRARGAIDVSGLWLWAPVAANTTTNPPSPPLATRNPALRSVVDGQQAKLIISEAERLSELAKPDQPLPELVILSGEQQAVALTPSWLGGWRRHSTTTFNASKLQPEAVLWERLRSAIDAA